MLKIGYPEIVIAKMRRWVEKAYAEYPVDLEAKGLGSGTGKPADLNKRARKLWFHDRFTLDLTYVEKVLMYRDKGHLDQVSGRVLRNMGFVVMLADLETTSQQIVEVDAPCEVDHSRPTSPRSIKD